MREEKNTRRSTVYIGFDGRVHKVFRGHEAEERFNNEVKVLKYLETKGCDFVPRLLDYDPDSLKIITSNAGKKVEVLSDEKIDEIFNELEKYGVRHDDQFLRNITYRLSDGKFCVIDFEFATILNDSKPTLAGNDPKSSPASVSWSCSTNVGRFRNNNEDAYLALILKAEGIHFLGSQGKSEIDNSDHIFAVSDGMGGANSGEFASRIAVEKITSSFPQCFRSDVSEYGTSSDILTQLFRDINSEMNRYGESYPECKGMGATLSMCLLLPGIIRIAHIGDSRIYHLTTDKEGNKIFHQLTDDDTRVASLLKNGEISKYEARNHPMRNMLTKALGADNQFVDPQINEFSVKEGDRLLICSDGVTDGICNNELEGLLAKGSDAEVIVDYAVKVSGKDNATAVLLDFF